MFVRFTTESGAAARHYGFQEALKATATANSGFTPSLPGGCIDYQVLSNDEAGGWVENTDWSDPLTSTSDSSGTYAIMSGLTSKDFGIENMSKHLKIQFDGTNGDFEQIHIGSVIPDGQYSGNNSPFNTTVTSDLNDATSATHGTSWFLSITSSYCWIWQNGVGLPSFFGIADLDGVPPAYKSVSNYWAPWAFFGTFAGTNHKQLNATISQNGVFPYYRGSDGNGPMTEGDWQTFDCGNNNNIPLYGSVPELSIYTYDGTSHPSNDVYRKAINTNGEYTDSLHPIAFYSPMNNFPYMPLKGVKAVGRFVGLSQTDSTNGASTYQQYINKIVYDENGDRYMIVHPQPWAPVAFRCV